jgi:predicted RNase H-like nuclease
MENYKTFVGVDGCPGGWAAVFLTQKGGYKVKVFQDFASIVLPLKEALVLVDIPIGLSADGNRLCDIAARKVLGARRSSVFTTPCRLAADAPTYSTAKEINLELTGKSLSKQAWNITAKINEVNDFLLLKANPLVTVREVHPEVCFWGLNQKIPMREYKKTNDGYNQRQSLLNRYYAPAHFLIHNAFINNQRRQLSLDDIVDALCAAVTGWLSQGELLSLPEIPEADQYGLPMEMVYWTPPPGALQEPNPEDILELCSQGQQWCHICPRAECCDNTNPKVKI